MPDVEVDHRNLIKRDNAFLNLREASHAQNMANQTVRSSNKSGVRGVYWEKTSGKWRASINAGGRRIDLGKFKTKEQAAAARAAAVTIHHGEFACLK
ncbi:AP2 domain-containing protein [Agrobacterium sp. ST15.13.015]|uniref:AP2 domain-containing protein n=1 Tax=Agrobacterium sp. ST15.13.015 TaxID=3017319 RepID=UPI003FA41A8A